MSAADPHSDAPVDRTPVRTLETDRLRLEPLALIHAPGIQRHINDWDVVKYLHVRCPWPYPDDGARAFIESVQDGIRKGELYVWAVTLKEEPGEGIGCISLEWQNGEWTRGFWLGSAFHRRGYMSEAAIAVTDFAFDETGIPKLVIPTMIGNDASSRLKGNMPGRVIRIEPVPEPRPGTEFKDQEVWEITAEEWRQWRAAP